MAEDRARKPGQMPPKRLALVAGAVSLFLPGMGHLLIGLTGRAITWFAGYVGFTLAVGVTRPGTALVLSAIIAIDAYVLGRAMPPRDSASATEVRH